MPLGFNSRLTLLRGILELLKELGAIKGEEAKSNNKVLKLPPHEDWATRTSPI
jgi:predicted deacylase